MDMQFRTEGGTPISPETAINLRQLIFGTSAVPLRCEWAQSALIFSPARESQAYGLVSPRNATRGLLSVLQGFILKNLLFKRSISSLAVLDALRPSEEQQIDALVTAMAEILSQISDKGNIFVVLPGEESFIPHSITYFQDTITEKLHVFQLEPKGTLQAFLKRHLNFFTGGDSAGTLLFLYSAVLTRSIGKTRSDLNKRSGGSSLVGSKEEGSLNIVNLLLTGRATPYIHNGVVHVCDEDNYADAQYGALCRSTIGLLLWDGDYRQQTSALQPGSRLKTPHLPIWITSCIGHFGVVINTNQELLRNYHAESQFELVYYSCAGQEVPMTIDNRGINELASLHQSAESSYSQAGPALLDGKDDSMNSPLQHLIHTKWEDASIKLHVQTGVVRNLFSN